MTIPSALELVARARALGPVLDRRASEQREMNHLPAETIYDIQNARFTRVMQPKRYGGYEMHPGTYADIHMALGEGDLSAAWVFGVYAGHSYHLGYFDDRAQRDVWGDNPDARIASPYAPTGKAVPFKDGYRLTGRWKFSSGSVHTDWIMLGALTTEDTPRYLIVLLPRADYEVVDVWNVVGLRGTGSNDIVAEDVFIPGYRTIEYPPSDQTYFPGHEVNHGLIYRIPQAQVFWRGLNSCSIGGLQAMLDRVVAHANEKITSRGQSTAGDPDVQLAVAEAANAIDEMKTILHRNFDRMVTLAADGKLPTQQERIMMTYQAVMVPDRALTHAKALFEATGGIGVFVDAGPFERIYRDLIAVRNHAASQWRGRARNLGAVMMGLPNTDVVYG